MSENPELDGSMLEALEALRELMRRDDERMQTLGTAALVRKLAGYREREIQEQLGLSAGEMRAISFRLERAAKALRAGL